VALVAEAAWHGATNRTTAGTVVSRGTGRLLLFELLDGNQSKEASSQTGNEA
jgi:hypothetical protein